MEQKFNLLKSYSSNKKFTTVSAGGTSTTGGSKEGYSSQEILGGQYPSILGFLTKLEKFYFCPPSDNLWTVSIGLETNTLSDALQNSSQILNLYNNIIEVNNKWKKEISSSKWDVDLKNTKDQNGKNFISNFSEIHGVFLAQNVNFQTIQATSNENFFSQGTQHSGFFNFGNVIQSRPNNRKLNISFLVSNWDIGDILFDPWIAAVTQKGLIEDGQASIKAKIIITEYSSGVPKNLTNDEVITQMHARKQYVFYGCVPTGRDEVRKNYESSEAGVFKTSIINFIYEDYKINYLI